MYKKKRLGCCLPVSPKRWLVSVSSRTIGKEKPCRDRLSLGVRKKGKRSSWSRAPLRYPYPERLSISCAGILLVVAAMTSDGGNGGSGVVGRVLRVLSPAPGSSGDGGGVVRELG